MKIKILTTIFLLISTVSFAQSPEHLTFKGVPIDGTLDQYVLKMKQNGFTQVREKNEMAILNGDFGGYKDCIIVVSTLKQKDLVHKISVVFPTKETWSSLSGNYFELKEMLTEKYGKASNIVEKFDTPSYSQPKDDGSRIYEVQFDRCKYNSVWQTSKGSIELSISHDGVLSCFVQLVYLDKTNGESIRAKAKDDL